MSRRLTSAIAAAVCLAVGSAFAQGDPSEYSAPAHVAVAQGTVTLERDGVAEAAVENMPLLQGDRLKTEAGRVEVVLPDGSILDLDRHTTVDLLDGGLLRLPAGRVIFVVARPYGGEARRDYQVDAPAGSVRFAGVGEYRVSTQVSTGQPFLEVSVVRGEAVVDAEGQSVPLRPGERAQVTQGQGVSAIGSFNSAVADAFIEWADSLRAERVGSLSAAYLPPELQVYGGAFDRGGSWDNSSEYGWVWYPNVDADWQPYYDGGWYPYAWGWTWVGGGRWTWPTHHYGRWGHGGHGWYWMPAARWSPAWVSWGFGADYVSWCPLGYHDVPAFGLSFGVSAGAVNFGWTVVPQRAFGHGNRVAPYALHGQNLRAVEHVTFAVRREGPPVPGGVDSQRFGNGRATPYDRAQAAAEQRVGGNPGWGRTTPAARTAATPHGSTTTPDARQGRAERIAGQPGMRGSEAAARPGSSANATGGPRAALLPSTSPAASPEWSRPTGSALSSSPLGNAVPRSAPSRPSESRSPYYYLGPSERRQLPDAPASTSDLPAAGPRGGRGDSAQPRGLPDVRSYAPPPASYGWRPQADGPQADAAQPGPAGARASSSGRAYPPAASASPNPAARTPAAPEGSAQPRPSPPSASAPAAGSPSPSSPASSGWAGGARTPGNSSGGAPGAGGRASGGAGASGGGRASSAGARPSGGRGGRGR